jgi:hypothetical protein
VLTMDLRVDGIQGLCPTTSMSGRVGRWKWVERLALVSVNPSPDEHEDLALAWRPPKPSWHLSAPGTP